MSMLPSQMFTVETKTRRLIAEYSTITNGGTRDPFIRIYPDACDVGIEILSSRTGKSTRWYEDSEVRDGTADNELIATIYRPTTETIRAIPQMKGWEVHILID